MSEGANNVLRGVEIGVDSGHLTVWNCRQRVRARCFGRFELFVDERPVPFCRSKSKELLAYLVDRRGVGASSAEIFSILWENRVYDRSIQKQVQTIISELMKRLRERGVEDIIVRSWNRIAVDPGKFECDYYEFLDDKTTVPDGFAGEYMLNYRWAESTALRLGLVSEAR